MIPQIPVDGRGLDWPRKVANAVNALLGRSLMPFEASATEPAAPLDGTTYYDTDRKMVRTYADGAWHDHWG